MTFLIDHPAAWARAQEQAAGDRALLARLVSAGKVMRTGPSPLDPPRVVRGMDTIRPKSKRRKR